MVYEARKQSMAWMADYSKHWSTWAHLSSSNHLVVTVIIELLKRDLHMQATGKLSWRISIDMSEHAARGRADTDSVARSLYQIREVFI